MTNLLARCYIFKKHETAILRPIDNYLNNVMRLRRDYSRARRRREKIGISDPRLRISNWKTAICDQYE